VTPRRNDPALLGGAVGVAVAGVELLSWSVIAGAVGVVALLGAARLSGRVPAHRRRDLLVGFLAAGAVALAVLAAVDAAEIARTAGRALGAACFAFAAWRLRRG
jgi:hypothetical protein